MASQGPDPRILHCIPTLLFGGAETRVRRFVPRLVSRGCAVAVVARMSASDAKALTETGVDVFPIDAPNHSPRLPFQTARAMALFRPTVVQTWLPQMDLVVGPVALARGVPWVLTEPSSALGYPPTLKNRARRALGRYARTIVANGPSGAAMWAGHADVRVIENGLDLAALAAAVPMPLDGPAPIVVTARLEDYKRVNILLEAFAHVLRARPETGLVLLGDGPQRAALEAQAATLGIAAAVQFLGFRSDVPRWLAAGRLFLSASAFEGQPNAVMEAAATGLPLILSDIAPHRDTFGANARYVAGEDVQGYADAILADLADPNAARARGAAAQSAMQAFSLDRAVDRFAALYAELSAAPRRPNVGRTSAATSA